MPLRPLLLSAALGLIAGAGLLHGNPAQARGHRVVSVRLAPPPPRHERVVVRPGFVWIPGYWRWHGGRHAWIAGYSAPARAGYVHRPARWRRQGPAWRFHHGYWQRR